MPAACRICHTVDGATVTPSLVSSPWIRRYPHSGFSLARRTGDRNLLYPMREALRARATVGEVCDVLREVWGGYRESDAQ